MPKKKETKQKHARSTKNDTNAHVKESKKKKLQGFPVIGLGASAGGLEALKNFFTAVTADSDMAYIVVIHMSPNQPSMLADLLQNVAPIKVATAVDGEKVQPNHVYVIPANKEITVYKEKIQLLDAVPQKGVSHPIDLFFQSLAQDLGSRSAGIIFSGTGTDGTSGVKEIKANEGLVLVQDEKTAGYDGMPRSAINTGVVDMVMPPEEMPAKLLEYFSRSSIKLRASTTTTNKYQKPLNKIFSILRTQVGHDFSVYKANTILRRIGRRMGLNHIENHETYVRFLRENPNEVDILFRELLIGVTSFFRDAESFDILSSTILPELLKEMKPDNTFRAWIPGCSTGEEVYSLAIALRECLEKTNVPINLQLFGTDIDSHAIDKAREGVYPESIAPDVGKERLNRFFTKEGKYYRIRKEIRDYAVFSVQDLIKDPPFSRLHLLCCRNLLIYLDSDAQKKLLPLFHYTLNPGGILVLGSSETIGGFGTLFKTLDKKWKIFERREVPQAMRQIVDFPSGPSIREHAYEVMPDAVNLQRPADISQLTKKAVLEQFAPTAILTNPKGDILHVQGRTGKYLETPSGPPTNNILDLAREGLRIELSSALRTAKSSAKPVIRKRLIVKTNGDTQMVDLHVCPQKSPKELAGNYLIVFEDVHNSSIPNGSEADLVDYSKLESSKIAELERELQITRESHQTTIEELESSNEEMKSTNEEMQSSNEELQSTNEELESSKEELQSLNEELQTVNAELQSKVEELSAAHDDMRNLLNSIEIATIFVDNNMRVRRFTPESTAIVNLIQTDIGRPLEHVVANVNYDSMIVDLKNVLEHLTPRETEVQTAAGKWYNMRIIPYRTTDNRIDGAVMTFSSIDLQKQAQDMLQNSMEEMEKAGALVNSVFNMNHTPMLVLDENGTIVIANDAIVERLDRARSDLLGIHFFKLHDSFSKNTDLQSELQTAFHDNTDFSTKTLTLQTIDGEHPYIIKGRVIKKEKNYPYRILLHFEKQE